jgi:hypothetical protein
MTGAVTNGLGPAVVAVMSPGNQLGNENAMRSILLGRLAVGAATVIVVAIAIVAVTVQSKAPANLFGLRNPYQIVTRVIAGGSHPIALGASLAGLFLVYLAYVAYTLVVVRRTGGLRQTEAEVGQSAPHRQEDESSRRAA